MMSKLFCGAVVAALLAGAAYAQDPVSIAKARHDHFKEIGKAMKAMVDEGKRPSPDITFFQANARIIDGLAPQLPSWFPAGTGRDVVPKSAALPVIWQKPDEFKKDAAGLASAAHTLDMAAQSGKLDAVGAAFPALGQACKTCHQAFKAKDD